MTNKAAKENEAVFGREFASIYNDKWETLGAFLWPFLHRQVSRRNRSASTWLDLCCGTGLFMKIVAQHGFAVTGVDLSPHQIELARRNLPDAELLVQDIRSLRLNRRFDVVSCMHDSLNYLTEGKDLLQAFRKVRTCLSPGGLFLFDMLTPKGGDTFWSGTSAYHDQDVTLLFEGQFDRETALGRYRITGFVKEGELYRRFREEHCQRGYSGEEVERFLAGAGFVFNKYDGHTAGRAGKHSERLLYVCRESATEIKPK